MWTKKEFMHNIIRVILSSAFLWASSCAAAQTASVVTPRNFTRLRTYTASDGSLWRDETVFFDGLGRESERVNGSFTPGNDLVHVVEYDSTGVAAVAWLPVPCPSGTAGFHDAAEVAAARSAAYADTHPFATTRRERSPLMRPVEVYGAGEAWHNGGKAARTAYLCNKYTGILRCGSYTGTGTFSSPVITRKNDRATDRLNVTQTTDEDGNTAYDFTEPSGRLLLHRRVSGDDCADTYYVYDDRRLLLAVLPPGASRAMDYNGTWSLDDSEELRQYAYLYRYDYNLHLSGRKLPGCEWETFEYDRLGQLVLSQTGNQRAAHEKTFIINDKFGRKTLVGISGGENKYWEICHVYAYRSTEKNAQLGYSIKWIDITSPKITEAYFYDDYSAISDLGLPGLAYKRTGNFDVRYANPKGKLTLSAEAVMNGGDIEGYVWTSYYYDDHDRIVQTASTLKGKSYDCTTYKYDFCGNVLKKFHQHGRSQSLLTTAETTTYEYDGYGRLLTERHNINGMGTVLLRNNTYDNLGRLVSSSRGNSDSLTTTYRYDIRNHRTYANSRLFYESLFYNTTRNGSTPLFNGRISASDAGVPPVYTGPLIVRPAVTSCNYSYDGFGRLVSATGYKDGHRTDDRDYEYSYDIMGNVERIRRTGQTGYNKYGVMDDISFEYDGNRIVKATNGGPGPYFGNTMHYADHADEPVEFAYDADGNLVSHADKGISRIRYNKISQPDILEFHDQSTVRYTYTGTGRKLRVDYCVVPNSIYMPDYPVFPNPDTLRVSRSYYGNHVYDSDSLTMVLFDGGYISFNGNVLSPRYHFYVSDHLGSVRVVADAKGNVEERDGYHPYGATDDSGRNTDFQPYKYCGKELDRMLSLDWLDHGARMYDPVVARWWRMDPLAEKDYDVSPYAMNVQWRSHKLCGQ